MSKGGTEKGGGGEKHKVSAKCVPNILPTVWPLLLSIIIQLILVM